MIQYIDWLLFSDKKNLICRRNQEAKYEYKKYLIYEKENEYNKLDLVNNIFIRRTTELSMEINFKEKTCKFDFGIEGNCKFDIDCLWEEKKDVIILRYNLDDSKKEIRIILKDLIL